MRMAGVILRASQHEVPSKVSGSVVYRAHVAQGFARDAQRAGESPLGTRLTHGGAGGVGSITPVSRGALKARSSP